MIKKFIIAIGVLGVFTVYSLGIRNQSPIISKPSSLMANSTPTTPTTSGGSGNGNGGTNSTAPTTTNTGQYKNGTYTGSTADAYYGNVQVSATISGGKLTDVTFLDYPHTHGTSVMINHQAMPYLQQEAIQAQSSNVQIISGATYTSEAFIQSLNAALAQANA